MRQVKADYDFAALSLYGKEEDFATASARERPQAYALLMEVCRDLERTIAKVKCDNAIHTWIDRAAPFYDRWRHLVSPSWQAEGPAPDRVAFEELQSIVEGYEAWYATGNDEEVTSDISSAGVLQAVSFLQANIRGGSALAHELALIHRVKTLSDELDAIYSEVFALAAEMGRMYEGDAFFNF